MIGRIISALAGRSIARSAGGMSAGPMGAVAGALLPTMLPRVARRMGPMGMIAAAAGGYALTKYMQKRRADAAVGRSGYGGLGQSAPTNTAYGSTPAYTTEGGVGGASSSGMTGDPTAFRR